MKYLAYAVKLNPKTELQNRIMDVSVYIRNENPLLWVCYFTFTEGHIV